MKVSRVDDEIFEPYLYSGPDVVAKFFEHIYNEQKTICEKLRIEKDMIKLTSTEQAQYDSASTCENCHKPFDRNSHVKVWHHQHTTGRFLGAVCGSCNLQLKYRKRKRPSNDEFFIPVVAHNMRGYDGHLTIKVYERHA